MCVILTGVAAQWSADVNLSIGAGSFTAPGAVSSVGLRLWVDSAESATVRSSPRVQLWFDKSGEARHLAVVPFGVAPYPTAAANRPQIVFEDGALAIGRPLPLNGITAFFVIRGGLDLGFHPLLGRIDRASGLVVDAKRLRSVSSGVSILSGIFGSINSTGIVMIRMNAGATDYVSLNGGTESAFSYNTTDSATHMGAMFSTSGTRLLRASVSEALVWDRALSLSERTSVLRALGSKWGVTVP